MINYTIFLHERQNFYTSFTRLEAIIGCATIETILNTLQIGDVF